MRLSTDPSKQGGGGDGSGSGSGGGGGVAGSVKYAQGGCNTRAKLCELIAAKTGGQ